MRAAFSLGVEIVTETIHETADGQKLWVLHGDRFDGVIAYAKWLAHVGDRAYGMALRLNDILFAARKALGLPYWSLSAFLKHKVKNAVEYISRFEEIVAREAASARRGRRGVRPYPSRRNPPHRRGALSQRRRLG